MTNWIEWNGGECPIKSGKTRVEIKCRDGYKATFLGTRCRWSHINSVHDIIAYRIIDDHEPMTREQIMAQMIELRTQFADKMAALSTQLEGLPKTKRYYWLNGELIYSLLKDATYTFDIETINGVPHIHGIAMNEVEK